MAENICKWVCREVDGEFVMIPVPGAKVRMPSTGEAPRPEKKLGTKAEARAEVERYIEAGKKSKFENQAITIR